MYRINIYGDIDPDHGVSVKDIAEQLDKADGQDIDLHISSGGGDAFEGIAIMDVLRLHPGRVVAVVEGLAASAASVIAVGGSDRLIMNGSSSLMIHDAWTGTAGNSRDMAKISDELNRMSDIYAKIYADKAGTDVPRWRAAMEEETWLSADEAVEVGLADEVRTSAAEKISASAYGRSRVLNSASVKWSSRAEAPTPSIINTFREEEDMSFKALADQLDTDEQTLQSALQTIIKAQAVEVTATIDVSYPEGNKIRPTEKITVEPVVATEDGEPASAAGVDFEVGSAPEGYAVEVAENGEVTVTAPSSVEPGDTVDIEILVGGNPVPLALEVAAVSEDNEPEDNEPAEGEAPPLNQVTLDQETYDELKAAAQFGWEAKASADKAAREAEVDQWISEGRISAGLRGKAVEAIHKDEKIARDLYGSNPKNTIPRAELGKTKVKNSTDRSNVDELIAKAANLRTSGK